MSCNYNDIHNKNELKMSMFSRSQGFTLIELMISLVLGLLISAAVMQVYLINTRTLTVQQSASEVQDSAIFALQGIEDHVRIANLGNPIIEITDETNHGGIVLTTTNLGTSNTTNSVNFTNSTGSAGWVGLSNMDGVASDQLTIQYKNITESSLFDCEGTEVVSGTDDWVVERYFIRADSAANDLALACDAGRVTDAGVVVVGESFDGNGTIITPGVDQFQVLLGAQTDIDNLTYLPANIYTQLTDKPSITTVKLGVVIRSSTPLINTEDKTTFTVLGTEQNLTADATRDTFYRRSYESTILLRNARVISVTGL
ncbi:type IV pilus assembly protein PilW [Psychrobacter fozii]|uniref:Type IV pilus assembly protein PilW n=2 Tax=Psychrobacter fozii TaxID=198480 RepID=A0A2V4V4K5_9GAMM|nr:type IV pilus assembly protein PilW [Psychrobacter fozii]